MHQIIREVASGIAAKAHLGQVALKLVDPGRSAWVERVGSIHSKELRFNLHMRR